MEAARNKIFKLENDFKIVRWRNVQKPIQSPVVPDQER